MIRRPWLLLFGLSVAHGLNDLLAGWLLSAQTHVSTPDRTLLLFVSYNVVAFGGQVPAALGLERWGHYGRAAAWALAALPLATLLPPSAAPAAIGLLALASAVYHVAGGALAMSLSIRPALAAGCFAAPGVVGLTTGSWLGQHSHLGPPAWMCALLVVGVVGLLRHAPREVTSLRSGDTQRPTAMQGLVLVLLALAALRSTLWNFTSAHVGTTPMLGLGVAVAAATGKIMGGWLLRRHLVVLQTTVALVGAVLLLLLPALTFPARLLGLALLQSTIPVGVVLLTELLRGRLALANALVMGLAVLLGGVSLWLPSGPASVVAGAGLLVLTYCFIRYWQPGPAVAPATAPAAARPTAA
ncbi:hypothetical protein [Hymenobacter tenuis]